MNVEQLKAILNEYPPSMKLAIRAGGKLMEDTTVLEVVLKLMAAEKPKLSNLSWYGLDNCIVRERISDTGPVFKSLEIDLR
jgi:hypothetical protein